MDKTTSKTTDNLSSEELKNLTEQANIFYKAGQYSEARLLLQKIVILQPDNDSALHMLAYTEHQSGNDEKSMALLQQALAINPQNERCYNLMAYLHVKAENLEEAKDCYLSALMINPRGAATYKNLGMIYLQQEDCDNGMKAFANAVLHEPQNLKFKQLFVTTATDFTVSGFDQEIKQAIMICLQEELLSHKFLESIWINILHNDPVFSLLRKINPDLPLASDGFENLITVLSRPYFLLGLQRFYLTSVRHEKILTMVRRLLLLNITGNNSNPSFLPLVQSLAQQCWLNEYVYSETEQEEKLVATLQESLTAECNNSSEDILKLSVLGCYRPLYKLENATKLLELFQSEPNPFLQLLLKIQIREPLEEKEIQSEIPIHGQIDNKISQDVRSQYEENPYPRWKTINVNNEISLSTDKMDILVAGCGTGQQPASMVPLFPNAKFLCIDLSLSSLAYAIRQCRSLNLLSQLTFIQGDILQLGSLGKKFDAIYCSGVLHHMEQPEEGLKVLKSLLKPGGTMYLSLYSEVARPHVVAARAYIKDHKLTSTPQDIRHMRRIIMNHPDAVLRQCMRAGDFFTMSQCRDLLFHVQEHRFTIPKIKAMLVRHKLSFLGFFYFAKKEMQQFHARFPEKGAFQDLDKWQQFEQERPDFFINRMYNFRAGHEGKAENSPV